MASFLAGLPREICLKKGEDESRVWFEFWKGSGKNLRGIVIQKLKSESVYYSKVAKKASPFKAGMN